jgi:hypothetical protein
MAIVEDLQGSYAFMRGGEIINEAPAVFPVTIDV